MLPSAGPSDNAPVSKAIFLSVGIHSLLASLLNLKHVFHLQIFPHVYHHRQIWRFFTTHIAFSNSTDILFGSLLIYHFRLLERQWGPRKYAAFTCVTLFLYTLLSVACLVFGRGVGVARVAAGPFGLIFAALYQYHREIPVTVRVRILGFGFSDKVFLYILSAQLLWSSFPGSILSGICGLIAGLLYSSDSLPFRHWRFPPLITQFATTYILPFLASSPATTLAAREADRRRATIPTSPSSPSSAGGVAMDNMHNGGGEQREAVVVPSEPHIEALVALGFSRDLAERALRQTGDDVDRAAAVLLNL